MIQPVRRLWGFLKARWGAFWASVTFGAAFLFLIAGIVGVVNFLNSALDLREKLWGPEWTYEINVNSSRLRIGQQAEAWIVKRLKKDGTAERINDQNCRWSYEPKLSIANSGPQCDGVTIRPTRADFLGKAGTVAPLKLQVSVWAVGGKPPASDARPDATRTIELVSLRLT